MSPSPKISRRRLLAVLLCLCLASILCGATFWLTLQVVESRLETHATETSNALLAHQETLNTQQLAHQEDTQNILNKLSGIQRQLTAHQGVLDAQSQRITLQDRRERVSDLQTRLDAIKHLLNTHTKALKSLKTTGQRQQSLAPRTKVAPVVTTPVSNQSKPKAKPIITPPFALFDVQKRGMHHLAIVGEANATHMSQLRALREGQTYQAWKVERITQQGVRLSKNTTTFFLEKP
ncbi:hypothetical protein [Vibrio sp. 10N.261.46.A3]|uniref:hypothetical protein n=1 Tax=Vibrio sp. 10N.261.46.A3 TaxID=3229658 RepID=UPI00354C08F0